MGDSEKHGREHYGGEYIVGDALDELRQIKTESAKVVHLDDAWARPKRCGEMGVKYPTHGIERSYSIVDECWRILQSDGWFLADADDWFHLKLANYLADEYGNVAETYEGGGYRRSGAVVYQRSDGGIDKGGAGMYLRNAGYHVLIGTKPDVDPCYEAVRQFAPRPDDYGWHSVKPLEPYREWIDSLTDPGDLVVEPCAGTAPASIAAEELGVEWLAVDIEVDAQLAFERRMAAGTRAQASLREVTESP